MQNQAIFFKRVSVEGTKIISAVADDVDYSILIYIGIGIAIGVASYLIILALIKKRYFRCDTCHEGAWKIKEEDSEGTRIMDLHKDHDVYYLNRKQYYDYNSEKKLYGFINGDKI